MSSQPHDAIHLVGAQSIEAAVAALYEGGASTLVVWSRSQERLSDAGREIVDLLAQEGCSFEPYVPAGPSALIEAANRLLKDVDVEGLGGSMLTRQCMVLVINSAQTLENDELQALKRLLVALAGSAVRVLLLASAPANPFDTDRSDARLASVCHLALDEQVIAPRRETAEKLDFELTAEPDRAASRSQSPGPLDLDSEHAADVPYKWKLKVLMATTAAALLLLAATAVLDQRNSQFSAALRHVFNAAPSADQSVSFDCGSYASETEMKVLRKAIDARLPVIDTKVGDRWALRVGPLATPKAVEEAKKLLWTVGACAINPSSDQRPFSKEKTHD